MQWEQGCWPLHLRFLFVHRSQAFLRSGPCPPSKLRFCPTDSPLIPLRSCAPRPPPPPPPPTGGSEILHLTSSVSLRDCMLWVSLSSSSVVVVSVDPLRCGNGRSSGRRDKSPLNVLELSSFAAAAPTPGACVAEFRWFIFWTRGKLVGCFGR